MDEIASEQRSRPQWAFHNLMRAHRLAHCALFDRLGLRDVGQPMLLFLLDDAAHDGRSCTQKGLGEALRLSASTVTASVKSLERHGYVRVAADVAVALEGFYRGRDRGRGQAQGRAQPLLRTLPPVAVGVVEQEQEHWLAHVPQVEPVGERGVRKPVGAHEIVERPFRARALLGRYFVHLDTPFG